MGLGEKTHFGNFGGDLSQARIDEQEGLGERWFIMDSISTGP